MTKTAFSLNPCLSFTLGRNHGIPEWLHCWVCVPGGVSGGQLYTPQSPHLFRFGMRAVLESPPIGALLDGLSIPEITDLWRRGWILSPAQAAALTDLPFAHHLLDDQGDPFAHHLLDDQGDGSATFIPSGRDQVQRLAPSLEDLLYRAPPPTGAGREMETAAMATAGLTEIAPLIGPACAAAAAEWYATLLKRGIMTKYTPERQRHSLHNDPVGRTLLHHLHPALSVVAGTSLRPTYSYAALYHEGATLPWHIDREACEFTLSLFLAHTPEPADGRNPWPLDVIVDEARPPLSLHPRIGGGAFFRGRRLSHARPMLSKGQESTVLMLHYVFADDATPRA